MSLIELRDVHKIYDGECALDIEDLRIGDGERVFVLGRSGSGKTTLLRLIKGRLKPTTGEVRVLGSNPMAPSKRVRRAVQYRVGMIDQEFYLVPRLPVLENVLNGCLGRVSEWKSLFGWFPTAEWEKAESILGEVELEGLANRRVETLSGGQRQRAAIARVLMQDPDVVLADEPVSNLDPELAEDALDLLVRCTARRNQTLLVSLHQPVLARQFATRIVGLSRGKVVYDGPPEAFTEERARFLYTAEDKPVEKTETAAPPPRRPYLRVLSGRKSAPPDRHEPPDAREEG